MKKPLKQWVAERAEREGITPHCVWSRMGRGIITRPKTEKVNGRVIYVVEEDVPPKPATDERYDAIRARLESLSTGELQRIIDNQALLCTDTFNYNETTKTYCPLALAMNFQHLPNPTNTMITRRLAQRFQPVNVVQGKAGAFYTHNRKQDLLLLCRHIIELREAKKPRLVPMTDKQFREWKTNGNFKLSHERILDVTNHISEGIHTLYSKAEAAEVATYWSLVADSLNQRLRLLGTDIIINAFELQKKHGLRHEAD